LEFKLIVPTPFRVAGETKFFGIVFSLPFRAKNTLQHIYLYRARIPSPRCAFAESSGAVAPELSAKAGRHERGARG
jgi:hypothetical protein